MNGHKIIVDIIDDRDIRCPCFVEINKKSFFFDATETKKSFEVESPTGVLEVSIKKESALKNRPWWAVCFLLVFEFIINLLSGHGPDETLSYERMPFEISFYEKREITNDTVVTYKFSNLIVIDYASIPGWERLVNVSTVMLFVLLLAVLVVAGFIIGGFFGVILLALSLPASAVVALLGRSRTLSLMDEVIQKMK